MAGLIEHVRYWGVENPDNAVAAGVVLALGLAAVLVALRATYGRMRRWTWPVRLVAVVACSATSALWVRMDGAIEGRVLWEYNAQHGFAQADLLAPPPLLLAAVVLVASRPSNWIELEPAR